MNLLIINIRLLLFIDVKYFFISLIFIFIFILICLFFVIAVYSFNAHKREKNNNCWQADLSDLINDAIFSETADTLYRIDKKSKKIWSNIKYRQCCIEEIIKARKALSGSSTVGLKNLYEHLDLDKDSFKKLSSRSWQKKAKGIQELSIMEQQKYVKYIFRLTTHRNETVRNEAQCCLVSFYGFNGLHFLNVNLHPLSEWQQIKLLNKLSTVKSVNTNMMGRWLRSEMESVVIFSLKLACLYNAYDMYDFVVQNLTHSGSKIKLHVLEYLKSMPAENTAERIIEEYAVGNKTFRQAVINTLQYIGSENEVPFLLQQLHDSDDDIKAAAAKALAYIHPSGNAFLFSHSYASVSPWNNIFRQVTNELAA